MIDLPLLFHIVAGLISLASGAVALFARKGARLHRVSGMIFVCAMLAMSATGAIIAALKPERLSVLAGLLACYLVTTALLTVRQSAQSSPWIALGSTYGSATNASPYPLIFHPFLFQFSGRSKSSLK